MRERSIIQGVVPELLKLGLLRQRDGGAAPVPIHQELVGGDHSFGSRFRPLRNRPPVFWCHFLESWLQDGENREKTRKNGAKMGEIWPNKKSAGRRPILDG